MKKILANDGIDAAGKTVGTQTTIADSVTKQSISINKPTLWSVANPYLYRVKLQVLKAGKIVDEQTITSGIRTFF